MSHSWMVRARDRAFDWILLTSLKFFIWLAFLAVPFLGVFVVVFGLSMALHSLGITRTAPDESAFGGIMFAGIVISSLLCIGLRTGAFDRLLSK
jgi:hypothetical protein